MKNQNHHIKVIISIIFYNNPNILADKIVEIYDNNPNSKVDNPKNKNKPVKLQNFINRIDRDEDINEQYKEFVTEFRNITNNKKIQYDYQTYRNLVLDKISNEEVSTSNDDSFIKKVVKEFIKSLKGESINQYKMIKINKDVLKKNILKIRYNNGRKVNNKYLNDDMIISNNMKNAILKNTNINKLSKNEYHVHTILNKYSKYWS